MKTKPFPFSQKYLKYIFTYKDGRLYWNHPPFTNGIRRGDKAGSFDESKGYYFVKVHGERFLLHRVVFFWYHGYVPNMLDHIDGNTKNNHISNLRPCEPHQNCRNRVARKGTSSKYKGVTFVTRNGKWQAQTKFEGKTYYLGQFKTEVAAAKAYDKFIAEHHGEFAKFNLRRKT